mmetsp:Transcript_22431/g.43041  ORF Transcript_22431/g.43041 Transcript_22431/m.43041 type:complete len:183 (+) Transcript_22431:171-719(+)
MPATRKAKQRLATLELNICSIRYAQSCITPNQIEQHIPMKIGTMTFSVLAADVGAVLPPLEFASGSGSGSGSEFPLALMPMHAPASQLDDSEVLAQPLPERVRVLVPVPQVTEQAPQLDHPLQVFFDDELPEPPCQLATTFCGTKETNSKGKQCMARTPTHPERNNFIFKTQTPQNEHLQNQ